MLALPLALLLLIVNAVTADDVDPVVEMPLGKVQGHFLDSRSGRRYMAFSGVPYAKPPVGKLRFQPPEALDLWRGIKEAKDAGKVCIQYDFSGKGVGVEDCLYLSVYTHNVSRKAPVLVVYHGGGFIVGSSDMVKPTYLMDKDIVIVNANYRIGIFGFLTFETKDMPGNQGLKDQTMVLRWVQQNIASFGGDVNDVTIHGFSAGGASVYHHYVSPLSKGLFHKGISSSGTSYNPWALSPPGLPRSNAEKLMSLIGCPTNPKEAIPCVMEKDSKEIIEKFPHFVVFQGFDPMLTFSPSLEEPGPGAFLVSPVDKWEHNPAPLLMVLSSAEGIFRVAFLLPKLKEYWDNFEKLAPVSLHYWASATNPDEVTKKVREYYFPGKKEITVDDHANLTHMYSDAWFNHGIIEGANKAKGDVYFMLFDYVGNGTIQPGAEKLMIGANHCGEMVYVWELNMPGYSPANPLQTEFEKKLSGDLVKMFVDFMKSGIANIPGSDMKWKTWTSKQNNYVTVTKDGFTLKEGLFQGRFKFWNSLNYQDKFHVQSS